MASEHQNVSPKKLRERTVRGFSVLGGMALILVGSWMIARQAPLVDETYAPFRQVLEWNGKLWHRLYNEDRLARAPLPPKGKKPRFNGDLGLGKAIDASKWTMSVVTESATESARPLELNMAAIRALPRTETSTEFKCIEGWSDVISYAGVRFSDFIKAYKLGVRPDGTSYRYVGLETPDGEYYVSIDMDSMIHPQTLLAYEMNGQPLDPPNGAPLRLIIPVKYGIKSLKRIGKIVFSDTRPPDYWEEQGYDWFAGL
jgi:hypothetical protein